MQTAKGRVFCSGRALSGVEAGGGGREKVDKGDTKKKGRETGENCQHSLSIFFKIFYKEKTTEKFKTFQSLLLFSVIPLSSNKAVLQHEKTSVH